MTAWRKLRQGYLMERPLCECCLESGITTPATDVHHLESPFEDGLSEPERLYRLLDPDNLKSLCQQCHGLLHKKKQMEK